MGRLSDNTRGAVLMMLAMASFTVNDASMKSLAGHLPFFQAVFLRGVVTLPLLVLLARVTGGLDFRFGRRDWGLVALRSLAETAAAYFFITALFHMPLGNATAILMALPLAMTLAGALFLGETVGWRRWMAIAVGFVGVLLIVRPGAEGFNIYSVYVLLTVACVTVRDLSARGLSPGVRSMSVAIVAAFTVTAFMGLGSLGETWVMPGRRETALLLAAAVLIVGGYIFSIMTMRVGEIAVVTPFRYTSLVWALILGLVVFGDWPRGLTLVGAGLIVATGIYTLYRERRVRRRAETAR
ncbi:DMT family transporter [Actibacterium sp. MT2.3-13A]|uniref:DMT family transporter n=1 Tax=Actibacterium sp. MT2.3-13A TaxID=2828332 RepID=UPI0032C21F21